MSDLDDYEYFKLRKEAKTYVSKVFTFGGSNTERLRNVKMVVEGSDSLHLGEIEGVLCLRLTGNVRKTQVSALVTQDDNGVKRLTLQTFRETGGDWIRSVEKEEFTFRPDEFNRLLGFLSQIKFIDLSNEDNFQIEDISTKAGPKAIIDASDREIVSKLLSMPEEQRSGLFGVLRQSLSH
jgi:hypothetical protein